jgi:hypothetical protein
MKRFQIDAYCMDNVQIAGSDRSMDIQKDLI